MADPDAVTLRPTLAQLDEPLASLDAAGDGVMHHLRRFVAAHPDDFRFVGDVDWR